jgi:hypothetical protein
MFYLAILFTAASIGYATVTFDIVSMIGIIVGAMPGLFLTMLAVDMMGKAVGKGSIL